MSLPVRALSLFLCLCVSSSALAQPIEVQPVPAPPPPPGYGYAPQPVVVGPVPCHMGADQKACLRAVLEGNPQYLAAKSRRNTGIVLLSVGTGVGVIALAAAWASWMTRDLSCGLFTQCHNDYTGEKVVAVSGSILFVVGLAVGIPMLVSGSREMKFIRNQYVPVPSVMVTPRLTSFGAIWRF